jgi:hypothetical protein
MQVSPLDILKYNARQKYVFFSLSKELKINFLISPTVVYILIDSNKQIVYKKKTSPVP